jgi:DNA-binding CsgD family transcriptional regulator
LLEGVEENIACVFVRASICVARGELLEAASMLRRRVRSAGDNCLESAPLVELLVEVEIELRETDGATTRARRLAAVAERSSCDTVLARGQRALGRALIAQGKTTDAVACLERAYGVFSRAELPLEAARTSLLLARAIGDSDREAATAEARASLSTFEALGAARDADAAAAYLRALGVKAARASSKGKGGLTRRELEVLELLGEGLSNRDLAARLCVTRKTVENHVASVLSKLELRGRAEATAYAVRHATRNSATN